MSGTSYLLDTNIILYLLAGDRTLADLLFRSTLCVSEITEIELLSYPDIPQKEKKTIEQFLSMASIIELNEPIKAHTISLRRKYRLKLPDAMIAATAQHMNLPLLSADKRLEKV